MKRQLLISCGWLALLLGAIGAVLPLLPTTPFILLAAACFARSSPRFHHWLLSHKTMGPIIARYQRGEGISKAVRNRALAALWLGMGISMWVVGQWWSFLLLGGIGLCTSIYLCRLARHSRESGSP
ncbi:YbaN family protein [Porticoccus sp. GXU_MW_L64]